MKVLFATSLLLTSAVAMPPPILKDTNSDVIFEDAPESKSNVPNPQPQVQPNPQSSPQPNPQPKARPILKDTNSDVIFEDASEPESDLPNPQPQVQKQPPATPHPQNTPVCAPSPSMAPSLVPLPPLPFIPTNPALPPYPYGVPINPEPNVGMPENPHRFDSDPVIKDLEDKIRALGVVPETQHYYSKKYIEKHYKHKSWRFKAEKFESYSIAKEKSGFFLGGGFGVGGLEESYSGDQVLSTDLGIKVPNDVFSAPVSLKSTFGMLNLELGYQQFFNLYFGTRIYGDLLVIPGLATIGTLNGNSTNKGFGKLFYALGSLDMDALIDIPLDKQKQHFIGAYAGFGVGLMLLRDFKNAAFNQVVANAYKSPNIFWKMLAQADYTINLGLAFTYKRHVRFELGTKIPLTYLRFGTESPAVYTNSQSSKTLLSGDIGFKRTTFMVFNVLYVF
uniref:OMP1022 n=2 Tax=Helicobacter salomonis TaxID=56878 RepID=A0A1M4NIS4_9HELI|nr:OMP1022 [Helicobacter salomonis]